MNAFFSGINKLQRIFLKVQNSFQEQPLLIYFEKANSKLRDKGRKHFPNYTQFTS